MKNYTLRDLRLVEQIYKFPLDPVFKNERESAAAQRIIKRHSGSTSNFKGALCLNAAAV